MTTRKLQVFHDGDVSERFAEMLPYFAADCEEAARVSFEEFPDYCKRHGYEEDNALNMERYTHYRWLGTRACSAWAPDAGVGH